MRDEPNVDSILVAYPSRERHYTVGWTLLRDVDDAESDDRGGPKVGKSLSETGIHNTK